MAITLNSPKLRELTRTELQSLAKVRSLVSKFGGRTNRVSQREVVRAVGKTEDIIRRLMDKHPQGVPAPEYVFHTDSHIHVLTKAAPRTSDNPSASPVPPKRNFFKKARGNALLNSPVLDTSHPRTDPKGIHHPVPLTSTRCSHFGHSIGKGRAIADPTSPSPSSSTEALELLDPEGNPSPSCKTTTHPPPPLKRTAKPRKYAAQHHRLKRQITAGE